MKDTLKKLANMMKEMGYKVVTAQQPSRPKSHNKPIQKPKKDYDIVVLDYMDQI